MDGVNLKLLYVIWGSSLSVTYFDNDYLTSQVQLICSIN